jgi:hypothetical protein
MSENQNPYRNKEPEDLITSINRRNQENISSINKKECKKHLGYYLGLRSGEKEIEFPSNPSPDFFYKLQIEIAIAQSYHTSLGLNPQEYIDSLPKLIIPDKKILDQFPIPLVVDPRIKNSERIRGFDDDIRERGGSVNELTNTEGTRNHPNVPYIVWSNDGSKYSKLTYKELMQKLSKSRNERPLNFIEALSLQKADTQLFFRNRNKYDTNGFGIGVGGTFSKDDPVAIYHNYMNLKDSGEFQVDAFGIYTPQAGWPTCYDSENQISQ